MTSKRSQARGAELSGQILGGFIAGALSVLVFHQGFVFLLGQAGLGSYPAYVWTSTRPFGVPQVLSLAFWGGLWGIAWTVLASKLKGGGRLGLAFWFGALLLPLVWVIVVAPLKGIDSSPLMKPRGLALALAVNGVWGLGTELFLRLGHRLDPATKL